VFLTNQYWILTCVIIMTSFLCCLQEHEGSWGRKLVHDLCQWSFTGI
jgi:hypothetical protein